MNPQQGCQALWRAMNSGLAQVTVLPPVNWVRLIGKLHPTVTPSRLKAVTAGEPARNHANGHHTNGHHANGHQVEATANVIEQVQRIAARILGAAAPPEVDRPLLASGFDSLMAMEMRAALIKMTGIHLPVSSFLSGLTLRDLAAQCAAAESRESFQEHRESFQI
jgi:acyl carrier protein